MDIPKLVGVIITGTNRYEKDLSQHYWHIQNRQLFEKWLQRGYEQWADRVINVQRDDPTNLSA